MPNVSIPDDTCRKPADMVDDATPAGDVLDFLDGLPAVTRTTDEWAEYDKVFLEGRVEWER